MARLIYSAIASLDGYVEDDQGQFGWAQPGEEVHAFVNDLEPLLDERRFRCGVVYLRYRF